MRLLLIYWILSVSYSYLADGWFHGPGCSLACKLDVASLEWVCPWVYPCDLFALSHLMVTIALGRSQSLERLVTPLKSDLSEAWNEWCHKSWSCVTHIIIASHILSPWVLHENSNKFCTLQMLNKYMKWMNVCESQLILKTVPVSYWNSCLGSCSNMW